MHNLQLHSQIKRQNTTTTTTTTTTTVSFYLAAYISGEHSKLGQVPSNARCFTGWMSFMSPNKQFQSTEG